MPQEYDPLVFQVDHVIARQHHGQTNAENLALACYACNHHKGPNIAGFDLESSLTIALFNPRRDVWASHFEWRRPELVGLTSKGRVTVHVLAINNDFRIALRQTLIDEGNFPR